jgi:hypothetical protein
MNGSALAACRGLGFREMGSIVRFAVGPIAFTAKPPLAQNYQVLLGRQARVHPRETLSAALPVICPVEDEEIDEPLVVSGCGREL